VTEKAIGIATAPCRSRSSAITAARPASCSEFVSSGVFVSRSAISPRVMTSVATYAGSATA
jgi:hypothetical protein